MTAILSIDESTGKQLNDTSLTLPSAFTGLGTEIERAYAASVLSFGANTIDVALTDSSGALLAGVDSTLNTLDGSNIYLYSSTTDNNMVFGRAADPITGLADPNGAIIFAIYLQTNGSTGDLGATSANLWVTEYQPLQHNLDGADSNDFVTLSGLLNVTVTNPIEFNPAGAPSGQNLFLMFGDGTPSLDDVTLVVTAKGAPDQSTGASLSSGATVNTGKGGGQTTIGDTNQMIDPTESMYFTFVTGANPDYTVKNLDQTEADVEANIDFTHLFGATKVSFSVVQLQPTKLASLEISALVAGVQDAHGTGIADDTPWSGTEYINHQDSNSSVEITGVVVTRTVVISKVTYIDTFTYHDGSMTAVRLNTKTGATTTATNAPTLNWSPGDDTHNVIIHGLIAGDKITYDSLTEHDRVLVTNVGDGSDANYNSAFDIGAFRIEAGGTSTSALGDIRFYDDGPTAAGTAVTATVDEDGPTLLPGANPSGPDDSNANSSATGSISGIFSAGADGLKTYSLSTDTSSLPALTSQGGTVLYNVTGNVLTAYVEIAGAGYNAADDREVFTLTLSGTNNSTYTFTMLDQLDHAAPPANTSFENELTLNLGSVLMVQDNDNDTARAASDRLVITVDDDSPVINSGATNPDPIPSGTLSGSGLFSYSIGVDDRDSYSATQSDLKISLGGTVGSSAISGTSATWSSETDHQATYSFAFTYPSDPTNPSATSNDTGTIVFDKDNGGYTVTLDHPILSYSVLTLNDAGVGFTGYIAGTNTVTNSQPPVSVAALSPDFFVQFTGVQETNGGTDGSNLAQQSQLSNNHNLDALAPGEAWSNGDDDEFSAGELFTQSASWVSVSTGTAGVAGDTMQAGEVLNFNFYSTDPKGFTSPSNPTTSSTIFMQFDGLDNGEDLVVVLKLHDPTGAHADTTRAVVVDYSDIFHKQQAGLIPASFGFTGTLDNNDGLVVIEKQDYNLASEGWWTIAGAQVLASTEGVSGSAVNLNGAIGAGGGWGDLATPYAMQSFADATEPGNTLTGNEAGTWDGDVFKITNLGFVTDTTPDATLNFDVRVIDYDGDTTAAQRLSVSFDGSSSNSLAAASLASTSAMADGGLNPTLTAWTTADHYLV